MREVFSLIWLALVGTFRSQASLEAEIIVLRHQLNVLRRNSGKRPTAGPFDVRERVSFGANGAGRLGDRKARDRD